MTRQAWSTGSDQGESLGPEEPARPERPRGDDSWRIEVKGNEVGKSWIGGTELNRVS